MPNKFGTVITAAPNMKWMHKVVIPRVSFCWEKVADYLEYEIEKKKEIEKKSHHDPTECCTHLMQDWLCSDRGVAPKTWNTLISTLKDIKELSSIVCTIEQELSQEGLL